MDVPDKTGIRRAQGDRVLQALREAAIEARQQLMRELNHRVKNHLFMVSTLVSLKDETLGAAADLSDIRGQVSTIAHLHEKLYQSDAVTTVEFEPYVRGLLTDVFTARGSVLCARWFPRSTLRWSSSDTRAPRSGSVFRWSSDGGNRAGPA
ncbi:MAG: histidine kinase dimerization/phosphoacceptor domain -containing protein [Spirochaetia bacterium]